MKKNAKKLLISAFLGIALLLFASCGEIRFLADGRIVIVSREAGSGTRGAFIELFGIEVNGIDQTYERAYISPGTNQVLTFVAGNPNAIGYVTIASISDDVRGVPINGVSPTAANVLAGNYTIYRPFYLAVSNDENPLRDDFINFILSAEGQAIVADNYVPVSTILAPFVASGLSGQLEVAGSTAVYPIVSLLAEAYSELTGVRVDVHSMGSSAGITQAIDGNVDVGMSSRSLNATELEGVNAIAIAYDGLAVIVHPDNPITNLTYEEVRGIFTGELSRWNYVAALD